MDETERYRYLPPMDRAGQDRPRPEPSVVELSGPYPRQSELDAAEPSPLVRATWRAWAILKGIGAMLIVLAGLAILICAAGYSQ